MTHKHAVVVDLNEVPDITIIDLTDLGGFDNREEEENPDPSPRRTGRGSDSPSRNPDLAPPFMKIPSIRLGNVEIQADRWKTVELQNGDFLRIRTIFKNTLTSEVFVRGDRLIRNRGLKAMFSNKLNEVCFYQEIDQDDHRSHEEQSAIEVSITQVVKIRSLVVTNRLFDATEPRFDESFGSDQREREKEAPLTARWKYVAVYATSADRALGKHLDRALICLLPSEIRAPKFRVESNVLRQNWRGETILGGAHRPDLGQDEEELIITGEGISRKRKRRISNPPPKIGPILPRGQTYTYGDAFCGIGGATRGAQDAGYTVKFGFDMDEDACRAWRRNFPFATCYQMSAFDFLDQKNKDLAHVQRVKVDQIHLSPPCQYFSPAHTVNNEKKDDANSATLFAVPEILRLCQPRVATLEQTFGILGKVNGSEVSQERAMYFCNLIRMFTDLGFSVRFKVVHLQDWGVPSIRKRLIIIASCPGEILPLFPARTHAKDPSFGSGLKKTPTINRAISRLPETDDPRIDHDISTAKASVDRMVHKPQTWDGDVLAKCITTNGGTEKLHPNAQRLFTIRETARIQTFPDCHGFAGSRTDKIKQIGNAVPPRAQQVECEWIYKQLRVADGFIDANTDKVKAGAKDEIDGRRGGPNLDNNKNAVIVVFD